jgi:hypothetical protein
MCVYVCADPDAVIDSHQLPSNPSSLTTVTEIPCPSIGIYMCLGPSIIPADSGHAGNIVALYGLDHIILKTATLCTSWFCAPLRGITFQAKPLVRVAVEVRLFDQSMHCICYGLLTFHVLLMVSM